MNGSSLTSPSPSSSASPAARPHARIWPWLLLGLMVFSLLAIFSSLAWLTSHGHDLGTGVHVVLDGEDWHADEPGTVLAVLAGVLSGGAVLVLGLVLGLLALLLAVPLALAVGLMGVAIVIAVALFAALLVAAAVLSPLWLPLLLLWLLLRRNPAPAPSPARMPA